MLQLKSLKHDNHHNSAALKSGFQASVVISFFEN